MKNTALLLLISFFPILNSFGQDLIFMKNNDKEIHAKIMEITSESIKYKDYNHLEGPLRSIKISEVNMIVYENGKREYFSKELLENNHYTSNEDKKLSEAEISNNYKWITIGGQNWMSENLNVNRFRNGDTIPYARTKEEWREAGVNGTPAWCYYDNKSDNDNKYGKLYNWYAVNDPRGLAPNGWEIPAFSDLKKLIDAAGGEPYAGQKLKSRVLWAENGNGNNESGFDALPAGVIGPKGDSAFRGFFFLIWTSTDDASNNAVTMNIYNNTSWVGLETTPKECGLSVRCIMK